MPKPKFYNNAPLSNKQKGVICQIAKQAHTKLAALDLVDDLPEKEWRHREQFQRFGLSSLTDARQGQYRAIRGHFLALNGQDAQSFDDAMNEGEEIKNSQQAAWHLEQVADEIGTVLVAAGRAQTTGAGRGYVLSAARRILHRPNLTWESLRKADADKISALVINAKRNLKTLRDKHGIHS